MIRFLTTLPLIAIVTAGLPLPAADPPGWAAAPNQFNLFFFLSKDCPISNYYAPEIKRICAENNDVRCVLAFPDQQASEAGIKTHLNEYGLSGIDFTIDRNYSLVSRAAAKVTPEAIVVNDRGQIVYRGRIDDRYVTWGKTRREVQSPDLRRALAEVTAGKPVSVSETKPIGCYIPELSVLRQSQRGKQ